MSNFSERDRFEAWLMEMDTAIDQFVSSAPSGLKAQLDLSAKSLGTIESWTLSRYANSDELRAINAAPFLDGAARYVGEIFRTRTGSKWTIELSDLNMVFYGLPVLTGGKLAADICPMTLVTACTNRRTGKYLSTILQNVTE